MTSRPCRPLADLRLALAGAARDLVLTDPAGLVVGKQPVDVADLVFGERDTHLGCLEQRRIER